MISLFAFTPIRGTKLENLSQPPLTKFRKIQLARYLLIKKIKTIKDFEFDSRGNISKIDYTLNELKSMINDETAFLTSGCPGCNRPFYTSRPSGPIYNYPRKLTENDKEEILSDLVQFVNL